MQKIRVLLMVLRHQHRYVGGRFSVSSDADAVYLRLINKMSLVSALCHCAVIGSFLTSSGL